MYNEEKMCVPENYEIGQEPLSAIIDRHDCLIGEALTMVKKIKMHIFGDDLSTSPSDNPKCMMKVLLIENENLDILCKELSDLCIKIGVL